MSGEHSPKRDSTPCTHEPGTQEPHNLYEVARHSLSQLSDGQGLCTQAAIEDAMMLDRMEEDADGQVASG